MKQRSALINRIFPPVVFLASFALYLTTLAPSVVPGDPGEYQFIPHILGIAHPPGYIFFTLLAKVWTTVVRIGSIAYRSNLLAAAAGAWTVVTTYGMVMLLWEPGANRPADHGSTDSSSANRDLKPSISVLQKHRNPIFRAIPPLLAALVLATSTDLWQHSNHANSHIVSAALSATTVYAGLRWWATSNDRWLYGFAFLAALGITHHPLLALGAPAYVAFALLASPNLLFDWGRLAKIFVAIVAGLSLFLYLPLRAGATPFGPSPNLDAIIGHATARGIRGNLFFFGLADQPVRLRVYLELLGLQYSLLTLIMTALGLAWLAIRRPRPFILLAVFYVLNVAFTINTVQDVMAYLLLPFTATAVLAGAGVLAFLIEASRILRNVRWHRVAVAGLTILLAAGPVTSIVRKAPRLTLRDYRHADRYINAVFSQFAGKGEGAVLLAPWEGMTPLHYAEFAEDRRLDPADAKLVFVASGTANPWVEFVWKHIEDGPIYLADYRPEVAAEGFRLRPVGDWPLYKLQPPPATDRPKIDHPLDLWADEAIHLLGWDLDRTILHTGETARLTLYMSAPQKLSEYYMPYLFLGNRVYRWTTDSRLNTPWWQKGEIIVEQYDITVPFGTPAGDYPLQLGFSNVSQGQDLTLSNGKTTWKLPVFIRVQPSDITPPESVRSSALANLKSRIVLLGGSATIRGRSVHAPWTEALTARIGDTVQVWLDWQALAAVDEPYTVFVHLIDGSGHPWAQHDFTPMGGAFPTFLWIPRWIEGQRVSDPYTLTIGPETPPGDYWLEAGMYGMTNLRRVYHFDPAGNLAGDRYILGPVRVELP